MLTTRATIGIRMRYTIGYRYNDWKCGACKAWNCARTSQCGRCGRVPKNRALTRKTLARRILTAAIDRQLAWWKL